MTRGIYAYIDKQDNNIVYVGLDSNIDKNKRHRNHLAPSNYNRQPINRVLQNNPDRYIYQVLWEIDDCTDNYLNQMEIYYIKKYKPQFNFTKGGGGISGFKHSEETRKKMSESTKGENHPMYGKTHLVETRKKMSESISEAHKGKSGFYRVCQQKDKCCKQGFVWWYRYTCFANKKRKIISSTNLLKLKEKVKAQGLPWEIIDEEKAKKSLELNNKYHK